MKRAQKLLLVIIVAEFCELGVLAWTHRDRPPLPRVDLRCFLAETAEDIGGFQDRVDRAKADDWIELAHHYRAFGLFDEADYCYQQGDRLGPSKDDYLVAWGNALDRGGRFEEALRRYEDAAAASARQAPECWLYIGLVHLRLGEYEPAEESLRKAAEIPEAKLMLSRRLMRSGRAREAVTLLDELLHAFPDDVHANQLRGWAEEELGNPSAAWPYQDQTLRGSTRIVSSSAMKARDEKRRYGVGDRRLVSQCQTLAEEMRFQQAIDLLRGASWAFAKPIGYVSVAGWEIELHRLRQAKQTLQECLARFGGADVPALKLLGDVCTQIGDDEQARAAWLQAIDIRADAELHRRLADSFARTPDKTAAERHAALAKFHEGKAAWLRSDLRAAREELQAASRMLNDHAPTWFYLAETLRPLGDEVAARAAYQRCLKINPDYGRALRGVERLSKAGR